MLEIERDTRMGAALRKAREIDAAIIEALNRSESLGLGKRADQALGIRVALIKAGFKVVRKAMREEER